MGFWELFIYFIIYSFFGWLGEIIWCSVDAKKFVKERGFLIGPWCPIYGFGASIIIYYIFPNFSNPFALFCASVIITTILEYLTSYFMELIFKERWWEYSQNKFNLNGRICLGNSIAFGVAALFLVYIADPILTDFINLFNPNLLFVLSLILFIFIMIDTIYSIISTLKLKKFIEEVNNIIESNTMILKKNFVKYKSKLHKFVTSLFNFGIKNKLKSFPNLSNSKTAELKKYLNNYIEKKKNNKM